MTSNGSGKYNSPSFRLTRLFRKQSAKGATYFAGRLAGAKIVVLKSRDVTDDGAEIWDVLVSEAPPRQNGQQPKAIPDDAQPNGPAPAPRQGVSPTLAAVKDQIPF